MDDRREAVARRDVSDLLAELSACWGMSWVDIAGMVGVSVPALRRWRTSASTASPDPQSRLVSLVSLARALDSETAVAHPAAWLSLPMVPGFSVTPQHLFSSQRVPLIVAYAAGNLSATDLLDALTPDWRMRYVSGFEVVLAPDGDLALRTRRVA